MICKSCGAYLSDDLTQCPICGAPTADAPAAPETSAAEAAEATSPEVAAPAENASLSVPDDILSTDHLTFEDEASEEAPTPKKSAVKVVALILAILLLVSGGGVASYLLFDNVRNFVDDVFSRSEKHSASDVVAEFGDYKLTNEMLAYYYQDFYIYITEAMGDAISQYFDPKKPLSEQTYQESDGTTWHDYFVGCAIDSWASTQAICIDAEAHGYELSAEALAEIEAIPANMAESAKSGGHADVSAFLTDYYGSYASIETYQDYMRDSYYSNSYYSEIFYENYNKYSAQIEGIEELNVSVRHILIKPADESDAALTEAQSKADALYRQWHDEGATEDKFAELAMANSADTSSAVYGGLYTDIYKGYMVEPFDAWCFDAARKPGDSGIVKTEYGYHVMYFVAWTNPNAYEKAEADVAEWYDSLLAGFEITKHIEKAYIS